MRTPETVTNTEKIIEKLEVLPGPTCDDCLSVEASVEPRQQVNQICRRLLHEGAIWRGVSACVVCGKSKQANRINQSPPSAPRRTGTPGRGRIRQPSPEEARNQLDRFLKSLWQKRSRSGTVDSFAGLISHLCDQGIIPVHQANMMHTIRSLRNVYVHEHLILGDREYAVLENAWAIIEKWAETSAPELWQRSL